MEAEGAYPVLEAMELEHRITSMYETTPENIEKLRYPSSYTCPDCVGLLWEIQDDQVLRFQCRVSHAYSAESMLVGKSEALEGAMWTTLNALEESTQMSRRLAPPILTLACTSTPRRASRNGCGRRGGKTDLIR